MSEFDSILWVGKYRPTKIEDMEVENPEPFRKYISKGEIPHLLFTGPPGGGKTTMARILVDNIIKDQRDLIIINGSEQRGIDVVRDIIKPFSRLVPQLSKHKIVWIEEADQLTEETQKSLRALFEENEKYTRFLLTGNHINKVHEAIISRCTGYKFTSLSKKKILEICKNILDQEKISCSDDSYINNIIDVYYPDFRTIINVMERFSSTGSLIVQSKEALLTSEMTIVDNIISSYKMIQSGNGKQAKETIYNIIKTLNNLNLDYKTVYEQLFFDDNVPVPVKVVIAKHSNLHTYALSKELNFSLMLFETCNTIAELQTLIQK